MLFYTFDKVFFTGLVPVLFVAVMSPVHAVIKLVCR